MNILRPADYTNMFDALRCCGANVHSTRYCSRLWSNRHFHIENRLRKDPDPLLTQNPKKAGRAGRKQWKIRRANGGKKHKSEPKRLRFVRETTYGPEGRGFESLTAYQKSSKSSDFEDFCFS